MEVAENSMFKPSRAIAYLGDQGNNGFATADNVAEYLPLTGAEGFGATFEANAQAAVLDTPVVGSMIAEGYRYDDITAIMEEDKNNLGYDPGVPHPMDSDAWKSPVFKQPNHRIASNDEKVALWLAERARWQTKHPDHKLRSISLDELNHGVGKHLEVIRRQADEVNARAEGFWANTGSFAGTMTGTMADPLMIGSMAVGAPWAAGVARFAITEMAIAGATEIAFQANAAERREHYGDRPLTFNEAAANVGFAAGGGLFLGGLLRGGGRLLENWMESSTNRLMALESIPEEKRTPDIKAAIVIERQQAVIEQNNPQPPSLSGEAAHGQMSAQAKDAANAGEIAPPLVSPAIRALPDTARTAVRKLVTMADESIESFAAKIDAYRKALGDVKNELSLTDTIDAMRQRAQTLRPAWRGVKKDKHGNELEEVFYRGEADDIHGDIAERRGAEMEADEARGFEFDPDFSTGFIDDAGKWYERNDAYDYVGIDKDMDPVLLKGDVANNELGAYGLRYLKQDDIEVQLPRMTAKLKEAGFTQKQIDDAILTVSAGGRLSDMPAMYPSKALTAGEQELRALFDHIGLGQGRQAKATPEQIAAGLRTIRDGLDAIESPTNLPKTLAEVDAVRQEKVAGEAETIHQRGDELEKDLDPDIKRANAVVDDIEETHAEEVKLAVAEGKAPPPEPRVSFEDEAGNMIEMDLSEYRAMIKAEKDEAKALVSCLAGSVT